ncbi:MAG: 23S rRNA (guanosine(2251)-2'-O)-methyltransferase RlmB [Flavobacteriales bacterium]|nr:23S rRNA (guanosine(2251)-2'-O)-methyltransferase RlmB [Flavobacteriales bacterium]
MRDKQKPDQNDQMVFGMRPVMEAIRAGKEIDSILIQKGLRGENLNELMDLIYERKLHLKRVPSDRLNRLTRKTHQGVICYISPIAYARLEDVLPTIYESGKDPMILLLDGITDVRNFGAIVRTAECAGVDAIVIPESGGARVTADAIKTSAGALNVIAVCRTRELIDAVKMVKDSGLSVIACTEQGKNDIYKTNLNQPVALILGSEETGISKACLDLADHVAGIPIKGQIESLNVSVAAGVILYEAIRQRSIS